MCFGNQSLTVSVQQMWTASTSGPSYHETMSFGLMYLSATAATAWASAWSERPPTLELATIVFVFTVNQVQTYENPLSKTLVMTAKFTSGHAETLLSLTRDGGCVGNELPRNNGLHERRIF